MSPRNWEKYTQEPSASFRKGEKRGMSFAYGFQVLFPNLATWTRPGSYPSSKVGSLLPITSAHTSSKYMGDVQAPRASGYLLSEIQRDPHKVALFPPSGPTASAHTWPSLASALGDPSSTQSQLLLLCTSPHLGNQTEFILCVIKQRSTYIF